MHRIEEMLGLHQGGDTVEDIVVGQDRAQKLLLGFDVVGQRIGFGARGSGNRQAGDFVHDDPLDPPLLAHPRQTGQSGNVWG
jgi:hypothetical protein